MIYYKVIGHLEDREESTGTFAFNEEKTVEYIERKFEKELFEAEGYDAEDVQDFKNSGKICYIDHIFKSNQPINGF
tara:strand:- start:523 stop:750 length:228 start_codon:yes stop_codon:yes gene_type:complete